MHKEEKNVLYDELCKLWPQCEEWIKLLHMKREEYHGGAFNGLNNPHETRGVHGGALD